MTGSGIAPLWPRRYRAAVMRTRTLFILFIVGLRTATPARAQVVVIGSSLAAAPNVSIDCAEQPMIQDTNGNYGSSASGVADCTWRQAGVFGVTSGDTRFSSVPGDGTITSVTVRSGPSPAPLRFVIFRQLASPSDGTNSQCCFYVSETNTVQLTPNAIETFQTNIPVQRNTLNGVRAFDLFGISAASNTGTLPLFVPFRINAFDLTTFGSVNAGIFYPRMGAIPNDVGGGRREEAIPGVELLVQWTWVPAGASLRNPAAAVANGRALVDLLCGGNAACRGVVELLRSNRGRAASKGSRYGKRTFEIGAGATAIVPIKLSAKAKKLVKKNGSLAAILQVTPTGGAPTSVDVTLAR